MTDKLADTIRYVATQTEKKYKGFVDRDDVLQELNLYALTAGSKTFARWAGEEDGQFRITRALFGAANQYAETEKAARSGYEFGDIAWYTPSRLYQLLPLALDSEWDGLTGAGEENESSSKQPSFESGTLLAMVSDVRTALGNAVDWAKPDDFDPETDLGMERLVALADRLGGEFPDAPGYRRGRRAISNAAAQVVTGRSY